jgi:hypothetical protein
MTELAERIVDAMKEFVENAKNNIQKGNKAAGARARKASLEIEKLLKEYRKASIEADKK